jgi:hypothetical protein
MQGVVIYLVLAYLGPLLHPQGSGAYALVAAVSGASTVISQVLFGGRRA